MSCCRRRWRCLKEEVGWFIGIAASLLLMAILLPLVPLFEAYDDIRRSFEE